MKAGRVTLVGAGPGDPELVTLRGLRRLQAADVVVHDALIDPRLLALAPHARRVDVGKRAGGKGPLQTRIERLLVRLARRGLEVVRLKGGDPFVFGRGGEELAALAAANIPWEVVPGISSALAAPASLAIPVTHRGVASSFAVVTGHAAPSSTEQARWASLVRSVDTLVVLMGLSRLQQLADQLVHAGCSSGTPAAVVQDATWEGQASVTGTLGDIAAKARAAGLRAPATLVVGRTVAAARDWLESAPEHWRSTG